MNDPGYDTPYRIERRKPPDVHVRPDHKLRWWQRAERCWCGLRHREPA